MGIFLHRTTKELIRGGHDPDFDPAVWLVLTTADLAGGIADIAALEAAAVPQRYWKPSGQRIVEMTAGEKAADDAARLPDGKRDLVTQLEIAEDRYIERRYQASVRETFRNMALNGPSAARLVYLRTLFTWLTSVAAYSNGRRTAINAAATKAVLDAVAVDFPGTLNGTDPGVTVAGALAIP